MNLGVRRDSGLEMYIYIWEPSVCRRRLKSCAKMNGRGCGRQEKTSDKRTVTEEDRRVMRSPGEGNFRKDKKGSNAKKGGVFNSIICP